MHSDNVGIAVQRMYVRTDHATSPAKQTSKAVARKRVASGGVRYEYRCNPVSKNISNYKDTLDWTRQIGEVPLSVGFSSISDQRRVWGFV